MTLTALAHIAEQRPLVHCIVNHVAMPWVADAVRAIGALPVMAADPLEAADMAEQASALVVNTGTPDPRRFEACLAAGARANERGIPVVLDPVGMGGTPWRTHEIWRLLSELRFTAIRGNRSEIASIIPLPPGEGATVRGVEATGPADLGALAVIARQAHQQTGAVICISGETDVIAGPETRLVRSGHAMLGELTGTGCMLGALIGAFLAVEPKALEAVTQAVVAFGSAGEAAAREAQGPGSFRVALIDSLAAIQRERTARGVHVEVLP